MPYIRERENAFRVAAERRCHRAESAFTHVPGEQITRGVSRSTRRVLRFDGRNSRDLQWGGTLSSSQTYAAHDSTRMYVCMYVLFPRWNTSYISPLSSHIVASACACNYCFIFDTRRHGLSMLRTSAVSRVNSFAAI